MAELGLLITAWDHAHWELGEALTGMPDEELWTRPHPNLLSVGELLAHIAYGEIRHGLVPDSGSPFDQDGFRYYPIIKEGETGLQLGLSEVQAELARVHALAKENYLASPLAADDPHPVRADWTWSYSLEYLVFHLAYHTGQIYSVRHLLGHETVDN